MARAWRVTMLMEARPGEKKMGRPISVARPTASSMAVRPGMRRMNISRPRWASSTPATMMAQSERKRSRMNQLACSRLPTLAGLLGGLGAQLGDAVQEAVEGVAIGEDLGGGVDLGHADEERQEGAEEEG